MDVNLDDIKTTFDLFKNGINLLRTAKDLLPSSPEKEAAIKSIDQAEKHALIAEAKLAESLQYPLCKKEWPPTILTATHIGKHKERYICSTCNTEYLRHGKKIGEIILEEIQPEEKST
jgi:hypothetical protein